MLRYAGYDIRRVYSESQDQKWFPFHISCQIPNLSSIYIQVFGKNHIGTVVEVGAYDGEKYSNSSGLIAKGWSGILIEPIPTYANLCREKYRGNSKVRVVERAASHVHGFATISVSGPLSTINDRLSLEYNQLDWAKGELSDHKIEVKTQTLDSILTENEVPAGFDVLIVDVEGFETEVFEGFDIGLWMPKLIIVELTDFHPTLKSGRHSHYLLAEKIITYNYRIIYKDSINTIYIDQEYLTKIFS